MGWPHDLDIDGRFLCHQMWSFMGLARNYSNPDNPCIYSALQCISPDLGSLSHPLLLNKNNMGCSWFLWKQKAKGPLSRLCGKNLAFRHWVGNLIKDEHDSLPSQEILSLLFSAQVVRAFPPAWYGHLQRLRRSFVRSASLGIKVISLKIPR